MISKKVETDVLNKRYKLGPFTEKVTQTRNFHTHFDESLEGTTAVSEELYWMTERLRLWLEAMLLVHLGCADGQMREVLPKRRRVESHAGGRDR